MGGLVYPAALVGGVARLLARGLGAGALARGVARGGHKQGLTVLTLPLTPWMSHEPVSPQAHDEGIGAWKEKNGAEKMRTAAERKRRKKGRNIFGGEEDGTAELTISP